MSYEEFDKAVETALERGEDPDAYLRFKTEPREQDCSECGHAISLHADQYGCDYEADRPDADIGQVAWRCGCKSIDHLQALLHRCWNATKKVAAVLLLLSLASVVRADSISQVATDLEQNSALPMSLSVADILAGNLLDAQAAAYYTAFEPDSLQLSIDCVLKAIDLYVWPGGPSAITDAQAEPIVFEQSRIAVDNRTSVSLSPTSIDFGDVPVNTPEPSALLLLLLPLALLVRYTSPSEREVEVTADQLEMNEHERQALRAFYARERKQNRAANVRLVWAIVRTLAKIGLVALVVGLILWLT